MVSGLWAGCGVVNMDKITTTKPITRQGNCLAINVSRECKMLGIDRGDIVEVTIKKIVDDLDEEPLTEEQLRELMCDERYASH